MIVDKSIKSWIQLIQLDGFDLAVRFIKSVNCAIKICFYSIYDFTDRSKPQQNISTRQTSQITNHLLPLSSTLSGYLPSNLHTLRSAAITTQFYSRKSTVNSISKMQFSASLFYVLSLLAISASSEREQEFATARIFLHKSTTSKFPLVVGSDFVVSYVVSNNGEASATDLTLTDRYDPSSFELIENVSVNGSVSFSVKELAPGALVSRISLSSHSQKLIILQPREFELSSTWFILRDV